MVAEGGEGERTQGGERGEARDKTWLGRSGTEKHVEGVQSEQGMGQAIAVVAGRDNRQGGGGEREHRRDR